MSAVELGWHRLPEVHGFQKGVLTARHSVARIVFQHAQGQPIIESQNKVGRTHHFPRHSEVRGFHHHGPRFARRQRAGHPTSEVCLHKNKNKKLTAIELGWHRLPEVHGLQKGGLSAKQSITRIVFRHAQGPPTIHRQKEAGRAYIFHRHSEVRAFRQRGPRFARHQKAGHPTSEVRSLKNKKLTAMELGWHRLPEVRRFRKGGLSAKESITRIVFRHVKESQSLRVRRKLAALTFSPNTAKSEPFPNVGHALQGVKGRDIETQKSACTPNVSGSDPAKA
ncbi:hypothetical protein MRX96_002405 [Rhipicephalus microplus]